MHTYIMSVAFCFSGLFLQYATTGVCDVAVTFDLLRTHEERRACVRLPASNPDSVSFVYNSSSHNPDACNVPWLLRAMIGFRYIQFYV